MFFRCDIREYLADRGRYSGSILRMADREPELFGAWLEGKDVDRPSPAKARGTFFHTAILEPECIREHVAFYPSRAEAQEYVVEEVEGPRGGKKKVKTDRTEPQDGSPGSEYKSMLLRSSYAKEQERQWKRDHAGKAWVIPEDQPVVQAMLRAVQEHPRAMEILGWGFEPEMTGHFLSENGVPLRIRPDAINLRRDIGIELKSYSPKGESDRLSLDPGQTFKLVKDQGFAIKSAMFHDGYRAITGRNAVLHWIVVEAREDNPRVIVVDDEPDRSMAELGRVGCRDRGIKGYHELARIAADMAASRDFRTAEVRDGLSDWRLPESLVTSMQFEADALPQIKGARKADG